MVLKFKKIMGRSLEASDGSIGSIKDVLFDDQSWKIRYFVIDTGNWLPGQKVLLNPKSFVGASDNIKDSIVVNLTKKQIKDAPSLETDEPVSRQNESSLHRYYGWAPYWGEIPSPLCPVQAGIFVFFFAVRCIDMDFYCCIFSIFCHLLFNKDEKFEFFKN